MIKQSGEQRLFRGEILTPGGGDGEVQLGGSQSALLLLIYQTRVHSCALRSLALLYFSSSFITGLKNHSCFLLLLFQAESLYFRELDDRIVLLSLHEFSAGDMMIQSLNYLQLYAIID